MLSANEVLLLRPLFARPHNNASSELWRARLWGGRGGDAAVKTVDADRAALAAAVAAVASGTTTSPSRIAAQARPLVLDAAARACASALHALGGARRVQAYQGLALLPSPLTGGGATDTGARLAVAMRLYEGESLAQRLFGGGRSGSGSGCSSSKAAPLPVAQAARLGASVAGALAELHACGLACGEVTPEHVLMVEGGDGDDYDIVLADPFGFSHVVAAAADAAVRAVLGARNESALQPRALLRAAVARRGSPRYMAPEQFCATAQAEGGPPADVWGLACVVLAAVTGAAPWSVAAGVEDGSSLPRSLSDLCRAVGGQGRAPPLPEWLPADLSAALLTCLDPMPERRPTAAQARRALLRCAVSADEVAAVAKARMMVVDAQQQQPQQPQWRSLTEFALAAERESLAGGGDCQAGRLLLMQQQQKRQQQQGAEEQEKEKEMVVAEEEEAIEAAAAAEEEQQEEEQGEAAAAAEDAAAAAAEPARAASWALELPEPPKAPAVQEEEEEVVVAADEEEETPLAPPPPPPPLPLVAAPAPAAAAPAAPAPHPALKARLRGGIRSLFGGGGTKPATPLVTPQAFFGSRTAPAVAPAVAVVAAAVAAPPAPPAPSAAPTNTTPTQSQAANELRAARLAANARALARRGDPIAAEAAAREAWLLLRSTLGPRHPAACSAACALASRLAGSSSTSTSPNRLSEAAALFAGVLAARREALGPAHPDTCLAAHNLGVCLQRGGFTEQALAAHAQALEGRRMVLAGGGGSSSAAAAAATAKSHRHVALCLVRLGRDSEAEPHLRRVLSTARAAAGDALIDGDGEGQMMQLPLGIEARRALLAAAVAAEELAACLQRQGREAEAEPFSREAQEARGDATAGSGGGVVVVQAEEEGEGEEEESALLLSAPGGGGGGAASGGGGDEAAAGNADADADADAVLVRVLEAQRRQEREEDDAAIAALEREVKGWRRG
jgi:hypothetical protein